MYHVISGTGVANVFLHVCVQFVSGQKHSTLIFGGSAVWRSRNAIVADTSMRRLNVLDG
jgi:hypothetical protein